MPKTRKEFLEKFMKLADIETMETADRIAQVFISLIKARNRPFKLLGTLPFLKLKTYKTYKGHSVLESESTESKEQNPSASSVIKNSFGLQGAYKGHSLFLDSQAL